MAFVLLKSQFEQGLQRQSALLLSSLRWLTDVEPFSIENVKTQLQKHQSQSFQELEFKAYLSEIFNLSLDYESLTPFEINVLNEIRFYLNPPVGIVCCGLEEPTLHNIEKVFTKRNSSQTNQYEAKLIFNSEVSCDVKSVKLTLSPIGLAPPPVDNQITLTTLGCLNGKQVFSKLWLDFVGDPIGHSYNLIFDFLNEFGSSIKVINDSVAF